MGAYTIDPAVINNEKNLPRERKGTYLLKDAFSRTKNATNNPISPDDIRIDNYPNTFCKVEIVKEKPFFWSSLVKEFPVIKGEQGHLPFATGIGKTTKVVNCIVRGGVKDEIASEKLSKDIEGRNIILVCPNQTLVDSAFIHQNT